MKRLLALLLALVMLLGIAGCASNADAPAEDADQTEQTETTDGETEEEEQQLSDLESSTEKLSASENPLVTDQDTVMISLANDLENLDPFLNSTINTNEVLSNVYEPLVNYDLEGNVTPGIASEWTYDEATMTYTITLRDDVYFHDGTQLTADDVVFSLEKGKETGRMSLSCNYIDTVSAIDPTTVSVTLTENYSPFLYFLGINLKMVCKSTYETNGGLSQVVNGTGPYKMVEYTPGDKVVMEAFDQYYGDQPAIPNLIFKIIPDANTQMISLQNGELNLSRDFAMNNIQDIVENPELDIYTGESGNVFYVGMNQSFEPFQDERVRQAINYAIDREFIIEVCEEGYGSVANSLANKGMFGYTEDAKYYEYDPEKAMELLAEAGYADGLEIPAILTKEGKFKSAAEVILEDLRAVGITTELNVRDNNGFTDDFQKGNYALCVTSINLSQDAHHVTMCFASDGYLNNFNINDPELDAAADAAAQEQDSETRKTMYHDLLCKVADEALFAPLYYPQKVWAVTSGLHNATYDRYVGVLAKYMSWE